jgi:hypothetical protein
MFEDGRTNVHDEEQSGRMAICSEWRIMLEVLIKKCVKRRRFTISELPCEFPQISRTDLYGIVIS